MLPTRRPKRVRLYDGGNARRKRRPCICGIGIRIGICTCAPRDRTFPAYLVDVSSLSRWIVDENDGDLVAAPSAA